MQCQSCKEITNRITMVPVCSDCLRMDVLMDSGDELIQQERERIFDGIRNMLTEPIIRTRSATDLHTDIKAIIYEKR